MTQSEKAEILRIVPCNFYWFGAHKFAANFYVRLIYGPQTLDNKNSPQILLTEAR